MKAGTRVKFWTPNRWMRDGGEYAEGTVLTGKARMMRPDGVGECEPHVRVMFDDSDRPYWYPARRLETVG